MNTTTNLTAGRNKVVHANVVQCGGKSLRGLTVTSAAVTCKRCLKALAAEAEKEAGYQRRLMASMAPSDDFAPEAAKAYWAAQNDDGIKGQLKGLLRF